MGISYANLATLSERLIRENGRDALLISETNTGTDYQPTITQTTETIRLVQSQFNALDNNDFVLQAHDVKFLVSSDFTLTAKQRIETNGQQYSCLLYTSPSPRD